MKLQLDILSAARRLKLTPYWVGGPVRDRLLGRPCHDWDLVTPHAKKLAQAVARKTRSKLITLDDQYRIYRLIQGELTVDFAEMHGKTIEEDLGRRDFTINAMAIPITDPSVAVIASPPFRRSNLSTTRHDRLLRLHESPRNDGNDGLDGDRLIDPFGGQRDLQKKTIRAVSQKAFTEDPLRLLRAYRFSAQFGFSIDPKTHGWIKKNHRLLQAGKVARERVREELLRLANQEGAAETIRAMDQSGLLTAIFPEIEAGRRVALAYYGKGGVVKHLLNSVQNVEWILRKVRGDLPFLWNSPVVAEKLKNYILSPLGGFPRLAYLKVAALLHDIGKPATAEMIRGRLRFFGHEEVGAKITQSVLSKLRFSRLECQGIQAWVRHHMRLGNLAASGRVTDKAIARYFRDLGEDGPGMLIVSLGDHYDYLARAQWGKGKDPVEKTAITLLNRYWLQQQTINPQKLINGHDLIRACRVKPGPLIGKLLEAIQDAQIEGRLHSKTEALFYAKTWLQGQKPPSPSKKAS
jgi:poly(A) polymerase